MPTQTKPQTHHRHRHDAERKKQQSQMLVFCGGRTDVRRFRAKYGRHSAVAYQTMAITHVTKVRKTLCSNFVSINNKPTKTKSTKQLPQSRPILVSPSLPSDLQPPIERPPHPWSWPAPWPPLHGIIVVYCMLMLFSYCFGQVWLLFLKGTNQILNFGGRPLFYSTHGTAMVWLWYAYGTITRM